MPQRVITWALHTMLASAITPWSTLCSPSSVRTAQDRAQPGVTAPTPREDSAPSIWFTQLDIPGLDNVFLCPRAIYSGAAPDGDAGFDAIKELGVRTILSVDGLAPDVTAAEARGMRYVHLPIGYDGFPPQQGISLAKALRDLPGPIYVHCHHGRHRSPAAVAYALAALGEVDACAARELLEAAGTSPTYMTLFELVDRTETIPDHRLDLHACEFPPVAHLSSLTEMMAQAGLVVERLEACKRAGWKTPPQHPDVVAASEAVMLAELLREMGRSAVAEGTRPRAFLDLLAESESAAGQLSDALGVREVGQCSDSPRVSDATPDVDATRLSGVVRSLDAARTSDVAKGSDAARAEQAHVRVTASCKGCHDKYRR